MKNYKKGIATAAAIMVMSTSMAASNMAIQEAHKSEARNLAAMNGQSCEYQVSVKGGYKCMNEEEKKAYDALPVSIGEKFIFGFLFGTLALVGGVLLVIIYQLIFG